MAAVYKFKPYNVGRWVIWSLLAIVLLLAPRLFTSNLSVTMLAQMGIAIIACLSYNMLLGQGGMLSFGHAVYTGLGSYMAMHALNAVGAGQLGIPVSLLPLVGGLSGMFFAVLLGFVTTKKAGTPFAMITMGVAELVFAMSLMFSEFFGGEAGISGNRVVGQPFMGITFGPQTQIYYLIAVYTFVCVALMYAFTQTPLGRILNAVRDNPERVEFIGYNTQRVRYFAFIIAGFFAGIAGGLGALNFEIVTAEVVSAHRSGAYLLFTFLGGATFFFGPIFDDHRLCAPVRTDQGMASVSGAGLFVHGHVRTRWFGQLDHDEPARGQIWQVAPDLDQLPGAGRHGLCDARGRWRHDRDGLSPAAQHGVGRYREVHGGAAQCQGCGQLGGRCLCAADRRGPVRVGPPPICVGVG